MISGIGTDIVELSRIQESIEKGESFKKLVFSPKEIAYCDGRARPTESYAARFAAKEAFMKAHGTGWRGKIAFNEISVENDDLGKPFINLSGEAKNAFNNGRHQQIHISMSHCQDYAMATVIIEKM